MAESFKSVLVSALIQVALDKLGDFIGKQLGIGEVLAADVEEEVGKLRSVLATVQAVLRHSEEKQLTDEHWLAKLKRVAYDAGNLLENLEVSLPREEDQEPLMKKVRRFASRDNTFLIRWGVVHKIKGILGRYHSLAEERHKFHLIADTAGAVGRMPGTRDGRPQTLSYVPESDVIGSEGDVEKIAKILIGRKHEKTFSVLPIVGTRRLRKITQLAQMVYNHPSVTEHFQTRIWVYVADNFDIAKIARKVIESVSMAGCDISDMDPLQRLLREALGGKRFLLVLNDIWNEDEQMSNELRILLTIGGAGSTVIATTRSQRVSSMGTLATYSFLTEQRKRKRHQTW